MIPPTPASPGAVGLCSQLCATIAAAPELGRQPAIVRQLARLLADAREQIHAPAPAIPDDDALALVRFVADKLRVRRKQLADEAGVAPEDSTFNRTLATLRDRKILLRTGGVYTVGPKCDPAWISSAAA